MSHRAAGSDRPGVIAPPPIIYLAAVGPGILLDAAWPVPLWPWPARAGVGGGLIAAGFALAAWAFRAFRAAGTNADPRKPATAVVEAGPFRYSRNPIYMGMNAIMIGLGVALDNVWIVGLLVPVLEIMRVGVIGREERYLEGKFGDAYRGYRARVRRWL